ITDSQSRARRLDAELGYFFTQSISSIKPLRVNFDGITAIGPTVIELFDNNNQPVNPGDIQNYKLTAASSTPRNTASAVRGGDLSLRRQLDYFSNPAALQIGISESTRAIDTRTRSDTYTYNGVSGDGAEPPALYLSALANRP